MWTVTAALLAAIGSNVKKPDTHFADKYGANPATYRFRAEGQKVPPKTRKRASSSGIYGQCVYFPEVIWGAPPIPISISIPASAPEPEPLKPTEQTDIDKVRQWLREHPEPEIIWDMGGFSYGQVVGTHHQACHAGITQFSRISTVLWSRSRNIGLREACVADNSRPAARAFFEWICGPESPWRSITKDFNSDIDFVIEHGFVIGDIDTAPPNLLYNFLIVSRFATEWAKYCDVWYQRVQAGVAPWYALYLSTRGHNDDRYYGGHAALTARVSPLLLLKGPDPKKLDKPGVMIGYSGADIIWDGDYTPPVEIWGPRPVTRTNTITGVTETYSGGRSDMNPDFEALVAACIKEQERIGAAS